MKKSEIEVILNSEATKSKKMLQFYDGGMEIGEIAKLMGVRYNFVYNVVSNECRKAGLEVRVVTKHGAVKESIAKLIDEGKSNTEIQKVLGTNYNYVFKVRKELEAKKKLEAQA